MNIFIGFCFLSYFLLFLQGKSDNTTYRHNSHSLGDLDTGTCKPRYLTSTQGKSLQVYR